MNSISSPLHLAGNNNLQQVSLAINDVQIGVAYIDTPVRGRPTLVLIHGFTGSAGGWQPVIEALTQPGLQVVALDMLGHGLSSAPEDPQRYSMQHCQDDIIATLQHLGIQPDTAILCGYSMGGRIALSTAFSGYFCALILESASPGLSTTSEREQRRNSDEALADGIERDGLETFIDYWQQLPLFSSQNNLPAAQKDALRRQRFNNRAPGLANSLRGVGTGAQPALHERLSQLNLPVLLLTGELDHKFTTIAQQMAHQLPDARLQIIPAAGHTIHLEQRATFITSLQTFCQSVFSSDSSGKLSTHLPQ